MPTRFSIIGLGEAGRLIGEGFAQDGATVLGYDPFITADAAVIDQRDSLKEALEDTDVVISTVGPNAASKVFEQAAYLMPSAAIYADFNTLSPANKKSINNHALKTGRDFVDIAVMAPVPRAGSRTPLLAAGPAAKRLADTVATFGTPVRVVSEQVGDAAAQKFLRSIFMKGLASLMIETLEAAEVSGLEEETRQQIAAELGDGGGALIDRLISGTKLHAVRRLHEMEAVSKYLEEIEVAQPMTRATVERLETMQPE